MKDKVLLFINGDAPASFPDPEQYGLIACTDGAFHYLKKLGFPIDKLDFISGDFDSHPGKENGIYEKKFIYTPDQDKTDFRKALEIIEERNFRKVEVLGGSGGEQDHFLGNLTVAFGYKDRLDIKFYDEFSAYYFIPESFTVRNVKDKMISLYPFPSVENITTHGLNWPLTNGNLNITSQIGTRNFAVEDEVSIKYEKGNLLIFIGKNYL